MHPVVKEAYLKYVVCKYYPQSDIAFVLCGFAIAVAIVLLGAIVNVVIKKPVGVINNFVFRIFEKIKKKIK